MKLPAVPDLALIAERLPLIFPQGIAYRNYVVREMAARTIYVMFYAGAIEGSGHWMRPSQVMDMTDQQANLLDDDSRMSWIAISLSQKKHRPQKTWYAPNSREPVRDETIRNGLVPCRAVIEREGIPTTSSKPRYALDVQFSNLFDSHLQGRSLDAAIENWQKSHLSKTSLTRMALLRRGATVARDAVQVTFPNGEIRSLKPGPSNVIAKAVIEQFAPRFLKQPAVLWLSESGNKIVARDDDLAKALGLNIDASKALPDIILIDIGADEAGTDMTVLFIEVVATDGPIDHGRKLALKSLATQAGFNEDSLAFLTAYGDRGNPVFKRSITELAWGSLAWFASEPDHIIDLHDTPPLKISGLRPNKL